MAHSSRDGTHAANAGDHHAAKNTKERENARMGEGHYVRLAVMALLSFVFMYVLMYAMVDVIGNVYSNYNQFYMAGLMAAPMVVLELLLMGAMYPNRRLNALFLAASGLAAVVFFTFIRGQTAISDRQFLRSMISHHASALLMCERASIHDPEVVELCGVILLSQQEQIDEMKAKLQELGG